MASWPGAGWSQTGAGPTPTEAPVAAEQSTDSSAVKLAPAPMKGRASTLLAEGDQWAAGTVGEQLDLDTTLVPFGKGALFVPALNNPLDEPPVTVLQDGLRVAEGTTGSRIVLSPGTYEVRLGSGTVLQRLRFQATVKEAHTTLIPVSWAGLSVHVVDEGYGSLRSSYELIRVDDREYMGIGFGTDEQAGEPVSTWILRPGLYKLVRLGDTYRARRDFATVRLLGGGHADFILVLNAETGEFAGAGEVPSGEIFRAGDGFFGSLVFGGDLSFNSRRGVPGLSDGVSLSFRAFLDSRITFEVYDNPLLLRLQVEEGQSRGPGLPWQKSSDRVDFDALYIYRLNSFVGPYVRLGVDTTLLPGTFQIPEGEMVAGQNNAPSPDVDSQARAAISPAFGVTSIKEGVGMNWRVFKSLFAETNVRGGVGARQNIVRRGTFAVSAPPADAVPDTTYFSLLNSSQQVGVEMTVLGVIRLTRWALLTLELDSLLPFDGLSNTILEVEASLALKLTRYLSLRYAFRYLRDPNLLEETDDRLEQDVVLRFSLDLF